MKKLLIVLAAGFTMIACNDAEKKADGNTNAATAVPNEQPAIGQAPGTDTQAAPAAPADTSTTTVEWLDGTEKNFGKMNEGENLDISFRFKNTGTKPLIIQKVWAQCGCTVPETPQKPYAPGETGVIKASFNSTAKVGKNTKEVYMLANTAQPTSTLIFSVEVKPKG